MARFGRHSLVVHRLMAGDAPVYEASMLILQPSRTARQEVSLLII